MVIKRCAAEDVLLRTFLFLSSWVRRCWFSELGTITHEFRQIPVDDAVAVLDWIAARENVFRVVVADFCKRCVFAFFRLAVCRHCHAGLHVSVLGIAAPENEIAFEFPDATDACCVSMCTGVCKYDVFENGSVVYPRVGIGGKIKPQIGEVVLLFAANRSAGFQVEPVAFAEYFGVLEYFNVAVQCFPFDFRTAFFEGVQNV